MIDLAAETVVILAEATRHLPRRRKGKQPAVQTIYRWAQSGCRGVRLETIQVGGTKCTSLQALQRFCDRLSHPDGAGPDTSRGARPRRKQKELERAERECEQAGL